jgi:hypothetical protein
MRPRKESITQNDLKQKKIGIKRMRVKVKIKSKLEGNKKKEGLN